MPVVQIIPGLEILDRSEWANAGPTGPLEAEAPGDVRFLLVHHTASSNNYGPDDVVPALRSFYGFHTGPEKGWPDIAYNFLVDRFGRVWEAREGSIEEPMKGSATGGSQGFALLCSFIGDHMAEAPTPEAAAAMGTLLGWLADKYSVDIAEGVSVEFLSRGSNRWPTGSSVTARTISGHREMSQTTCPGDLGFAAIDNVVSPKAREVLAQLQPPPTTAPPETTTPEPPETTTSTSSTTEAPTSSSGAPASEVAVEVVAAEPASIPTSWLVPAAALAAVAGAIGIRRRRI